MEHDEMIELEIEPHPLLDAAVFITTFEKSLGELSASDIFDELFDLGVDVSVKKDDQVKNVVRDLFRYGGFKPTGRNKPASEYLIKAATENRLSSINPAVDFCNIVSLHSGLPISVVDLAKTEGQLKIRIAPEDTSYVFNASGQEIQVDGLICLFDELGACANAVKDSQRTKTDDSTIETLNVVWGTQQLSGRTEQTKQWYQKLLSEFGARTRDVLG